MEWSDDLVLKFISLYEREPSIWNPKDPNYNNRSLVYDAWNRIEEQMSGGFSVVDLKKKKDALMASFRKLLRKIKISKENRSGSQNVFKPEWFAFDVMYGFLHSVYMPDETIDSEIEVKIEEIEVVQKEEHDSETIVEETAKVRKTNKRSMVKPSKGLVKKKKLQDPLEITNDYINHMNETQEDKPFITVNSTPTMLTAQSKNRNHNTTFGAPHDLVTTTRYLDTEDDECLTLAKGYATKLRKLTPHQLMFADKMINEVLFDAQMGLLTKNSRLVHPSPFTASASSTWECSNSSSPSQS